jgi:putative Holliday junction resolvase
MKGKLLGIDVGEKRTGIAETDPMQMIASPLETVETPKLIARLKILTATEPIAGIVIGKALDLQGGNAESAPFIEKVVNLIRKEFPEIPLHRIDERFTSKMAMQSMVTSGVSKGKRRDKGSLDRISAAIILQDFLRNTHL